MSNIANMKKNKIFIKSYYPGKKECFEILKQYETPIHVQKHCNAVGETAKVIAIALNKKGFKLNINLVTSAGYLHDIARVNKKHEKVGAEYLESIGLKDVSDIIKDHTKHKIKENILLLNEEDVLCIADRLVLEDSFVGPKLRMEYIKSKAIKKYGKESEEKLNKIIDDFIRFIHDLEVFIDDEIYNIIPQSIKQNKK